MSDVELPASRSPTPASNKEASPASQTKRSPSRERERTPSRSRSRSRSYRKYSRSRSRTPRRRSRSKYSRSRSRSRGRRYSRSRSRSPYYKERYRRSRYSRSPSYGRRRRGRSHSRSPMSSRRRHVGNRDNPKEGRCLGVFGLSLYTQERDLRDFFGQYGPMDQVQVVYDHQTGRSRGFGFIYFRNKEDAVEAKDSATGREIDGRKIRCDFSITQRAHTPTPGIYLGKPTHGYRSGYGGRRSPSPYYKKASRYSRSRSRSRSYSPRRY